MMYLHSFPCSVFTPFKRLRLHIQSATVSDLSALGMPRDELFVIQSASCRPIGTTLNLLVYSVRDI